MTDKDLEESPETNQCLEALLSNCGAVRSVTEAVEGTLGPKGLDCMLIDDLGSVLVTNDGITILKNMDVRHPAARLLIGAAAHQEKQVGDGTTTATVLTGALINEAVNQALKGVPIVKVIEGMRYGMGKALELLHNAVVFPKDIHSPILKEIALIAGRGYLDLAELAVSAAPIVGAERLQATEFRLADRVIGQEGCESCLLQGTVIEREPLNRAMPRRIDEAKLLIIDDALDAVKVNDEALGTTAGFERQLENEAELKANLIKLAELGVKAVFCDRAICDQAEELLTDLGILAVQGVAREQWLRLVELTGARPIKRSGLSRPLSQLASVTGLAAAVMVERNYKQVRVLGYPNQNGVTILVGGSTPEVVSERERIVKDAAAAVQAAWRHGVVPGGGSVELAVARRLGVFQPPSMMSYGFQCVVEALKRPLIQICLNAGFNPLEKMEQIVTRTESQCSYGYGINCDTGEVQDMTLKGVWDPYEVKRCAFQTAMEVSEAILRIGAIVKMRDTGPGTEAYH